MTVTELIAELNAYPPFAKVVVDRWSDFGEVTGVSTEELVDRGGYLSSSRYGVPPTTPSETCVYINNF